MHIARTVSDLREHVRAFRAAGERVAFVPTMGNLHAGHLSLVDEARRRADRIVVSVFVNPTQFGPNEDFARYPRTESEDAARLAKGGADILFLPSVEEMYPGGTQAGTFVEVPELSERFCGASRPGHFRGVATVVARLFNIVQPDVAVFGEKDFQQLLVIRRMVRELAFPVDVVGVATAREPDGLAMSSRNQYLSADERAIAPRLRAILLAAAAHLRNADPETVEAGAMQALAEAGFAPEYVAVRRAEDLEITRDAAEERVILAAARLGSTRLIDNLRVPSE